MNDAAIEEVRPAQQSEPESSRAGRGFVSITFAKLYFLVAGYAVQLFLPRLLRTPEMFGLFSAALSFVSILNNVLISATIQVVSKRVSEDAAHAPQTLRQALRLQLAISASLSALLFAAAPQLAHVLLDPQLTPLFRLAAIVVFAYALYATLIGALNGQQAFLLQARFDMGYTTLRSFGMLGLAALGFGAIGAFAGFAGASLAIMLVALWVVGIGEPGATRPLSSWFSFMAPLWLYQLCQNLILQADIGLLKRSVAELAQAGGSAAAVAADTASRYVGFYRAAQTLAFVPYQLIMPVSLVIFPMISGALSAADEDAARRYTRGALRASLLLLLAVAAPFAGAARSVMRLVYPAGYESAAPALSVLVLAMVCLALFVIAASIMTAAGRPGLAARVAVVAVLVVVAGNLGFVHYAGLGAHTLLAAASGTGLGTVTALAAVAIAVFARFRAFIPLATCARALLATAGGAAAAHLLEGDLPATPRLYALLPLAAGGLAYLGCLLLSREFTRDDLNALLRMTRLRR